METMTAQHKAFSADLTVEQGSRTFVAKMTSDAIDRDREVLDPNGMDSTDFEKNPILFYGHDYTSVENVVGLVVALKRETDADGRVTGWYAKCQLAERPEDHEGPWRPDTVLALMRQGIIRGVSVGFDPVQVRNATADDRKRYGASAERVFSRWKLLELSVAPLPANQDALVEAVAKAIKGEQITEDAARELLPDLVIEQAKRYAVAIPEYKRPVRRSVAVGDWHAEQRIKARQSRAAQVSRLVAEAVKHEIAKARGDLWV
jgi:uncharacterized protein